MDGMLYERTIIAKQPDTLVPRELAQLQQQAADASPALFLKDPYLLDFKPDYKGQVELYLKWLATNEQQPGEHPPSPSSSAVAKMPKSSS